MVALLDETGARREGDRYFAYGLPFGIPRSDVDGDGDVDGTDYTLAAAAFGTSAGDMGYDVKADVDLDGTVTAYDTAHISAEIGFNLGRGNLSRDPTLGGGAGGGGNRLGYAGYQWDPEVSKYSVRHRDLDPVTGRWLSRDPIGYTRDASLYEYAKSRALVLVDPSGLFCQCEVDCQREEDLDCWARQDICERTHPKGDGHCDQVYQDCKNEWFGVCDTYCGWWCPTPYILQSRISIVTAAP